MSKKEESSGEKNQKGSGKKPKARYKKPVIQTEKLTAVAALCNGTASPPRKSTTSAPEFCSGAFLKS